MAWTVCWGGLTRAFTVIGLLIGSVLGISAPSRSDPLPLGQLQLTDAHGDARPLVELLPAGNAILHFWASWCAPCRKELPAIAAFRKDLEERGLADRLIVISVDSKPREQIAAFLRDDLDLGDFQTYQADSRLVGAIFRFDGYPATVFLNAEIKETGRQSGPLDWADGRVREDLLNRLQ